MLALSFPLSFLLTLTSCSQDADALPNPMSLTFEVEELSDDVTRTAYLTPEGSTGQKGLLLSCRVLDGIVRPDTDSVPATRGTRLSSMSSFGVSAAVYPAASTYSFQPCGSLFFAQQVTAGAPTGWFWPGNGKEVSFYAYHPYGSSCFTLSSTAASTGVPVYSYTVPASVASQPDIMTAQVTDIAGDTGGSVALPFRHRCTALRFSLTNEGSDAVTVTSVSVSGVYGSGTLQGDTWTPGTPASSFTLAPSSGWTIAADATADLTGATDIFFMVPQTLPFGAKLVVVTSEDTYEAELTGSWLAGKTYGYELTKTGNTLIVDEDSEIEDWYRCYEYESVDLGLPSGLLWAKCNVGAEDETDSLSTRQMTTMPGSYITIIRQIRK